MNQNMELPPPWQKVTRDFFFGQSRKNKPQLTLKGFTYNSDKRPVAEGSSYYRFRCKGKVPEDKGSCCTALVRVSINKDWFIISNSEHTCEDGKDNRSLMELKFDYSQPYKLSNPPQMFSLNSQVSSLASQQISTSEMNSQAHNSRMKCRHCKQSFLQSELQDHEYLCKHEEDKDSSLGKRLNPFTNEVLQRVIKDDEVDDLEFGNETTKSSKQVETLQQLLGPITELIKPNLGKIGEALAKLDEGDLSQAQTLRELYSNLAQGIQGLENFRSQETPAAKIKPFNIYQSPSLMPSVNPSAFSNKSIPQYMLPQGVYDNSSLFKYNNPIPNCSIGNNSDIDMSRIGGYHPCKGPTFNPSKPIKNFQISAKSDSGDYLNISRDLISDLSLDQSGGMNINISDMLDKNQIQPHLTSLQELQEPTVTNQAEIKEQEQLIPVVVENSMEKPREEASVAKKSTGTPKQKKRDNKKNKKSAKTQAQDNTSIACNPKSTPKKRIQIDKECEHLKKVSAKAATNAFFNKPMNPNPSETIVNKQQPKTQVPNKSLLNSIERNSDVNSKSNYRNLKVSTELKKGRNSKAVPDHLAASTSSKSKLSEQSSSLNTKVKCNTVNEKTPTKAKNVTAADDYDDVTTPYPTLNAKELDQRVEQICHELTTNKVDEVLKTMSQLERASVADFAFFLLAACQLKNTPTDEHIERIEKRLHSLYEKSATFIPSKIVGKSHLVNKHYKPRNTIVFTN